MCALVTGVQTCALPIFGWALSGPVFGYSDTWQPVVNTATTVVSFLMVFLIQNSQNRDGAAMQATLDEIGSGSRRERVRKDGSISVVAGSLKKKIKMNAIT